MVNGWGDESPTLDRLRCSALLRYFIKSLPENDLCLGRSPPPAARLLLDRLLLDFSSLSGQNTGVRST